VLRDPLVAEDMPHLRSTNAAAVVEAGIHHGVTLRHARAPYPEAAATCPGLSWTLLAGTVESPNVTSDLPGVHSGANSAGVEGPLQMEPG
jgi:hypothetical protein